VARCPSCECRYRTPEAFLGRKVSCKSCGTSFTVEFEDENQQNEESQATMLKEKEVDTISQDDAYLVIGKLAVKYQFVAEEQIQEALIIQKQEKLAGNKSLLGEILVAQGMISRNQLNFLLSVQKVIETRKMDRKFGLIALKNGFATPEDIETALKVQKESYEKTKAVRMLGDILVESKVMTKDQCDVILRKQKRFDPIETVETETPEMPVTSRASVNDDYFDLTVSEDKMNAFFSIKKENAGLFTIQDIKEYLETKGIKYGIVDDEKISDYIEKKEGWDTPLIIAEGKLPEPGIDASIKYYFDTDPLKIGTIKNGGSIDFKDRGNIPQVKKGDLLAEKIPTVEGTAGNDVYGRYLAVPKPIDKTLRKGKGASLSEDKLKIIAETDGIPEISAVGKIYVSPRLEISGGVGLKTGHVDFEGKIDVIGTIQSGYRVKGNSLKANEILKAEVEVAGDIIVSGGIIGAKIKSGGSLSAMYVHESEIEILGDVLISKEIIDSKINTSGSCMARGGPILSSRISAKKGIQAVQVGSEISKPCHLSVGFDEKVKEDINALKERIPKIKQEEAEYQRRLREIENEPGIIEKVIADMAQVQDRAEVKRRALIEEMEKLKAAGDDIHYEESEANLSELDLEIKNRETKLENLFNKQDGIKSEISDIQQKIEDSKNKIQDLREKISEIVEWSTAEKGVPEITVHDAIFADTTINGIYSSLRINHSQKSVLISEDIPKEAGDSSQWDLDRDKYGSKIRINPL
ncbi:MAG: FapA family protein, partial [Desulfobacterales bacterium]